MSKIYQIIKINSVSRRIIEFVSEKFSSFFSGFMKDICTISDNHVAQVNIIPKNDLN